MQDARDFGSLRIFEDAHKRHTLIHGDNAIGLQYVAHARQLRERVALVYLDPPYFTNVVHQALVRPRDSKSSEQGGPLHQRPKAVAFDDRWSSRGEYLESIRMRLVVIRELLAPYGSVVVHLDSRVSHYVKVLGDEIFGEECFASEIVWRYRRWPAKTANFQRVHDVLLRWRKSVETSPRFCQLYEPLAPSTVATWGTNKQRAVFKSDGRRARSVTTSQASQGVPLGDVWDIGVIAPISKERTGYPTQKPEALLGRVVRALSDENDVVLDPYAGSGTTLAVAAQLGRRFVGIDASDVAVKTALGRLERAGVPLSSVGDGSQNIIPHRE